MSATRQTQESGIRLSQSRSHPVGETWSSTSTATAETDSQRTTHIRGNMKMFYFRVQTMLRQRRRKQKRALEISAPYDLKREPICLPGISEDEISILKEKAAASCVGIAESMPRSPSAAMLCFPAAATRPSLGATLTSSATVPTRLALA